MARGRRDLGLEWRERMAGWQASGLSVREFCQRRALTEPTFHYWRRELRMRDAAITDMDERPVRKFRQVLLSPVENGGASRWKIRVKMAAHMRAVR